MSAIIPWNDPGGAPCCCGLVCEHTASSDPTKWDQLIGGPFSPAAQVEITPQQFELFTAGGFLTYTVSGGLSVSGQKAIPPLPPIEPDPLTLHGTYGFSVTRTVESQFVPSSCKQKSLEWTNKAFSISCASNGFSTGSGAEFHPYMDKDVGIVYPCQTLVNAMSARFSFYNKEGTTPGKLYDYGMYFQFAAQFSSFRALLFGMVGFASQFDLLLGGQWAIGHAQDNPVGYLTLSTDAGEILLPYNGSPNATASMTFSASAP